MWDVARVGRGYGGSTILHAPSFESGLRFAECAASTHDHLCQPGTTPTGGGDGERARAHAHTIAASAHLLSPDPTSTGGPGQGPS